MLRFLLSGTPGKTLLTQTSVQADTPLMRVQIKQTTHRCEEESLRYEAGLKQKVPPGSTLNRMTFISQVLSGQKENLHSCPATCDIVSSASVVSHLHCFFNGRQGNRVCSGPAF